MNRRTLSAAFLPAALLACLLVAGLAQPQPSAPARPNPAPPPSTKPTRILLIATALDHPFGTHQYSDVCKLLAKCLNQTQGIEAVVCPDFEWPKDSAALDGVKSIVYYGKAAGDIVLAPERREKFEKLMHSGVGFVAIHWATCAQSTDLGPAYLDILGGWFNQAHSGLKIDSLPLVQPSPDHPICRGWKPYDIHEEFYLNLKFHPKAVPILKVTVDGTDQTVAWAFQRGGSDGRSFGTTLGHFHDNFASDSFRRALVNGILWTAHVDVPKDGAPVAATPDDLKPTPAEQPAK